MGNLTGFYEDDNISLEELIRKERIEGIQDYDANYANHIIKKGGKFKMLHEDDDEAYALGDYEHASKKMDSKIGAEKQRKQQINDKQRVQMNLQKCTFCIESKKFGRRDAMISASEHVYLAMDGMNQCILPGQTIIVPLEHVQAVTDLDDPVWSEIRSYQKSLVRYWEAQNPPQAVIFCESAISRVTRDKAMLGAGSHTVIVAYPVEVELLAEVRAYWKKALDEAEDEFTTQHTKVIETDSQNGVRGKIPKNFAYIHADFSGRGGFAHIVEDSVEFQRNFVQHTIAGMCELTILDRAYHEKRDYRQACAAFKRDFKKDFDWTEEGEVLQR